jgi:single-strand DNA-binding protein
MVGLVGELRQDRWQQDGQNRSRVEIVITNIQLLGGGSGGGGPGGGNSGAWSGGGSNPGGGNYSGGNGGNWSNAGTPAATDSYGGQEAPPAPPAADDGFADDIPF